MIKEEDILFHTPNPVPYDWAETGFFGFYIPSADLMGWVYFVHRAGVGATVADIEIVDRWSEYIHDAAYMLMTHHNPLPERAERFTLDTGFSFEARSLREYRIGYKASDIELDIEAIGIMEPYDIHDPSMDPMAVADEAAAIANSGFGSAYASHFDMTVRVKGSLRLGDRRLPIDCVATMDHSWGPRPEVALTPILWVNAHFGESYALHGIFAYDRYAPIGQQHSFKHGYALIDGKVRGANAGMVRTTRKGLYPLTTEVTLTDVDGREHRLSGEAVTHHPWMAYGNNLAPVCMMRWQAGDAEGHGTYMEGMPLNNLRAG